MVTGGRPGHQRPGRPGRGGDAGRRGRTGKERRGGARGRGGRRGRRRPVARGRSAFPAGCDADRRMDDRQSGHLGCLHRRHDISLEPRTRPWRPCEPSRWAQARRQRGERSSPDPGDSRGCVSVTLGWQAQTIRELASVLSAQYVRPVLLRRRRPGRIAPLTGSCPGNAPSARPGSPRPRPAGFRDIRTTLPCPASAPKPGNPAPAAHPAPKIAARPHSTTLASPPMRKPAQKLKG